MKKRYIVGGLLLIALAVGAWFGRPYIELLLMGDERELREAPEGQGPVVEERADLLIIAIDGLGRDVVYEMLEAGELPGLAKLLGDGPKLPHAYLADNVLSIFPSTTLPAWATLFSAEPPAVHGVAGNEYFIREKMEMAAPAPVSFTAMEPVAQNFTDGYADKLLEVPTIYERMREDEPGIRIWIDMSHFHEGADRLLVAAEAIYVDAFETFVAAMVDEDEDVYELYRSLDDEVLESLLERSEQESLPNVVTIYLPGLDLFTHQEDEHGPDKARRVFLKEVLDPKFATLYDHAAKRGGMKNRWVVLTADHGHSEVRPERRLLRPQEEGDARAVLTAAGFRVRPFTWQTDEPFQAVLAYGGATAYVYLADRSGCEGEDEPCDWKQPPRYREDVLAAAEAFHQANQTGEGGALMKGTLDAILVREPRPWQADDLPFEVYLGGGRTTPLRQWLKDNPRPTYQRFDERMRLLAVGPRGERAGDLVLLARFGNVDEASERYYFAGEYRSWHGSPSARDSEVPLVVAHPGWTTEQIRRLVTRELGPTPTLVDVGRLLLTLRTRRVDETRPKR